MRHAYMMLMYVLGYYTKYAAYMMLMYVLGYYTKYAACKTVISKKEVEYNAHFIIKAIMTKYDNKYEIMNHERLGGKVFGTP